MAQLRHWWWHYDGPTWLVALVIYGSWTLIVWFHAVLPWWLILPLGAYVVAWQFSLQHETIHGFRSAPAWLRFAVAFPPLGLWFPYPLYRDSHRLHHRNTHLTVPGVDTESYYVSQAAWRAAGPLGRALMLLNQTLLVRLLFGPMIRLWKLTRREVGRVVNGDFRYLPVWALHAVGVGIIFWFVSDIAAMPWWHYIVLMAYPGMSLGLLRAFIEHRAGARPGERTAIIRSNAVFSLMFLNNNLHAAHHLKPGLSWYRLPGFYRDNREKLLAHNGGFQFRGYWQIARQYLLKPVFLPVHPTAE